MAKYPAHLRRRKPPFFHPVIVRARAGGWTIQRQCLFLAELYLSGCVTTAARRVGLTRMSAYRLRARPDAASFARAWQSVLSPPGTGKLPLAKVDWRKVTQNEVIEQLEVGKVQPVLYRGEVIAIRRKPTNSALLRMLKRSDAGLARSEWQLDRMGR